jgi:hypothetical protein
MIRFTTLGTRPFDGGIIQVVGSDGDPSFGTIIIFIVTMCILGIGPIITISGRNRFYRQHRNYALDNRKQSRIIAQNRQNGIYEKSYQGNIPVRKPLAGGRVGEQPARIIRNETIAQPKQDNLNRNNNQSGTQSERRPAGTISQPIAPRQEYRREEQKQVQPRRESAPRQMETRPSRPVERSPQPTFTPPPRQEPQQAPRQSATPSNNGASERRGRR